MSELMDSSDLRAYAVGLLYILSAVMPSVQYVEPVMNALIEAVRSSPVRDSLTLTTRVIDRYVSRGGFDCRCCRSCKSSISGNCR